ncbi:MAG TPA: hypothetical protein PLM33_13335, partial [Acidobacteriota bacterium]|nr:hypothetical protein [Acidobacteriota bacterium]
LQHVEEQHRSSPGYRVLVSCVRRIHRRYLSIPVLCRILLDTCSTPDVVRRTRYVVRRHAGVEAAGTFRVRCWAG